jgi:hypothetical protein
VAQQEEEDDPEEHQGDAPVPATAGLLLGVGEDADRRVGLHRPVDLVQTSLKLFFSWSPRLFHPLHSMTESNVMRAKVIEPD